MSDSTCYRPWLKKKKKERKLQIIFFFNHEWRWIVSFYTCEVRSPQLAQLNQVGTTGYRGLQNGMTTFLVRLNAEHVILFVFSAIRFDLTAQLISSLIRQIQSPASQSVNSDYLVECVRESACLAACDPNHLYWRLGVPLYGNFQREISTREN